MDFSERLIDGCGNFHRLRLTAVARHSEPAH